MPTSQLFVIGAGGHAKVVLDALTSSEFARKSVALLDDDVDVCGGVVLGVEVNAFSVEPIKAGDVFHVAIGDNAARSRKFSQLGQYARPLTILHVRSIASRSSFIDEGTFVAAGAVVGPAAQIGRGCIVNHGAVIDHDCLVGEFCHIAPNATLGGNVCLGKRVLIGAGANVLPGVTIGDDCIVGAGAVVLNDLIAGMVYVGIPAKKHHDRELK